MCKLKVAAIGVAVFAAHAAMGQQSEPIDVERLYLNNCASCHGIVGEGDGPVASVMRVTMPNLRTLAARNDGEFPADAVRAYIDGRTIPAAHGERYMPVWGDELGWGAGDEDAPEERSEQRATAAIDALVEHLRALQYTER